MTYKLIALDLDGTLKSTDKQMLDCMQKLMSWN